MSFVCNGADYKKKIKELKIDPKEIDKVIEGYKRKSRRVERIIEGYTRNPKLHRFWRIGVRGNCPAGILILL